MTRINDSSNQSVEQLKATTQQLALRVNQLERLLDGKDIDEVNFLDGMAHQRKTKFSLSNGMMKTDWLETDVNATGGVESIIAGTAISISPVTGIGDVTVNAVTFDPTENDVWVGGKKSTVPSKTTDYLNVPLNGDDCTWIASMPAAQMPEDAEVYAVTKTPWGDIHLPGNFGL